MPGPTKRFEDVLNVNVDTETKTRLEAIAVGSYVTVSDVVRTALREYLAKHGEKAA